jgi:hypothetical protein
VIIWKCPFNVFLNLKVRRRLLWMQKLEITFPLLWWMKNSVSFEKILSHINFPCWYSRHLVEYCFHYLLLKVILSYMFTYDSNLRYIFYLKILQQTLNHFTLIQYLYFFIVLFFPLMTLKSSSHFQLPHHLKCKLFI